MVNNNFYAFANELMSRATGTITNVVDYASYIDEGKKLAELSIEDLTNVWLNPIMNKVQKTLNDNPSYIGALTDMYMVDGMNYGVLETIMSTFYEMSASAFDGDTLTDGTIYTDQFKYSKPTIEATYHILSGSWERDISIRMTDAKATVTSPEKLDNLIQTIFIGIGNSCEHAKEVARLGLLADSIRLANSAPAEETDETKGARHYRLVSIYNETHGTELTTATALNNDDFVKWAILTINDIGGLMTKPATTFNGEAFKTFTPVDYQRLKVNGVFSKAVKRAVIGAFNPDNMIFNTTPEILPYWQNSADRMRITTNTEAESVTTYSDHVIACLYDKRAMFEAIQAEEVTNTPNNKRRYITYHYLFNRMYGINKYANFVIFTLD